MLNERSVVRRSKLLTGAIGAKGCPDLWQQVVEEEAQSW